MKKLLLKLLGCLQRWIQTSGVGKCGSCAYYAGNAPKGNLQYSCVCPKMLYGYGKRWVEGADEVLIEDDEGWGMKPGPNFGCIHYRYK